MALNKQAYGWFLKLSSLQRPCGHVIAISNLHNQL